MLALLKQKKIFQVVYKRGQKKQSWQIWHLDICRDRDWVDSEALGSEGMKHGHSRAVRFYFFIILDLFLHHSGVLEFLVASPWQLLEIFQAVQMQFLLSTLNF